MFDKTKQKVDTLINDRVTQPVKFAVLIAVSAFVVAGLALIVALGSHSAD